MSDKMICQDLRIIFMVVYGTGTSSFNSSNQLRTMLNCRGDEFPFGVAPSLRIRKRKRLTSLNKSGLIEHRILQTIEQMLASRRTNASGDTLMAGLAYLPFSQRSLMRVAYARQWWNSRLH